MASPLFTVFTPTFNRASTLRRPFESLSRQTFRDFEWVVVDDGSSDGTPELLRALAAEAPFDVRTFVQPNRGKHFAMNRGASEARGPLLAILDSDDECLPGALGRLAGLWDDIDAAQRERFAGVTGRCAYADGTIVGPPLPRPVLDASPQELRYVWKIRAEMWGFVRTDLLRAHPMPEDLERTYVPESLAWDRIGRTHRWRYVDEVFRTYHRDTLASSLGSPRDPARSAAGAVAQHRAVLDEEQRWFRAAPLEFLRSAVHYARFSLHRSIGPVGQWRGLTHPRARLLWAAAFPLALAVWGRDRIARAGRP